MKEIKKHIKGILFCLFELAVGILLLINPLGFTTGIVIAAGVALLVLALVLVIKYCRVETKAAAQGQYLLKGLLALAGGAFCVIKPQWLVVTFPAFTVLYGVAVLTAGFVKVQFAVDMLRAKNDRWFFCLVGAVVSIACAVVILNDPFATTAALWLFTGISLIVEAVVDGAMLILSNTKKIKLTAKEPAVKNT